MDDVTRANVEYFKTHAETYDTEPHMCKENRNRVLEALFNYGGSHLDIGCGTGFIQEATKGLFERSEGIDISPEMLVKNPHPCRVGDIYALPYEDNTFDLVTAYAVLHHLIFPEKVVQEVRRVLKPGGTFWTGLDPNLEWSEGCIREPREDEPFYKGVSENLLFELCDNNGFQHTETYGHHFNLEHKMSALSAVRRDHVRAYLNLVWPASSPLFKYIGLKATK